MIIHPHRTKIVATIGPASCSPDMIRQMIEAGMSVARLNFSHGSYEDHAEKIQLLRQVAQDMDMSLALLQDLQGPKIRVGHLPTGEMSLTSNQTVTLVPLNDYQETPHSIPIDYPYITEEAEVGTPILLDDGNLELAVTKIQGTTVDCQVIRGGRLQSRKGVNFPTLNLRLPSLTEKDKQDLEFGLSQGMDWVALSFVRQVEDIYALKTLLEKHGKPDVPVLAKIEKPQAIAHLDAIIQTCEGIMVARGDLGVEMNPEKVPMLQKRIIRACNQHGIPAITATQMLDSMIENPNPTRAEASDVANAIIDGTDAVMLSGESAVGKYPLRAVQMLARIATEVEPGLEFTNLPPETHSETHALSEALNTVDKIVDLRWIATFTTTGYTVSLAAAERPRAPIIAFTVDQAVYYRLNLIWGVTPILLDDNIKALDPLINAIEDTLCRLQLAEKGDKVLIMGSSPVQQARGTNFLKIHTITGL
ncbi:pyruvate kinase [Spirulina sp. CS-785/01]|uniref:pyruvate kinase n=1 Tax=Spirulina sp. CS-785/01 TaxID=3021716 RepID=UPI00232AF559|nr:pyruvate kinase [Spirulina sp. CS-785/01]MDB9313535.1 pyruvate kinase [Spirulina sp. CS-785/01]